MELNLKELAEKIHENAKAKGFYDNKDHQFFEYAQVFEIIKEVAEFHEAYKKGKDGAGDWYLEDPEEVGASAVFSACIKDTWQDEMADVVIRLLDFMRYNEFEILQPTIFVQEILIGDSKYWLSKECFKMIDALQQIEDYFCRDIVNHIYTIAKTLGIDLEWHIRAKMAYNTTRERLHGKKF
jgi:NTP pyrophosphatase (non-canonical NTP hydrolase)